MILIFSGLQTNSAGYSNSRHASGIFQASKWAEEERFDRDAEGRRKRKEEELPFLEAILAMDEAAVKKKGSSDAMEVFSPTSPPRIFWNSRKRSGSGRSLEKAMEEEKEKADEAKAADGGSKSKESSSSMATDDMTAENPIPPLSDRRRALFEPLAPAPAGRISNEDLLPPPDFDAVNYPKGWVVGKKRKLVNVDVVESMRRIAVQEMNRKDREIDGLNEQLEEDSRCLEHLQIQLLEERSKRADLERENAMLHDQISMLMSMLQDPETAEQEEDADTQPEN